MRRTKIVATLGPATDTPAVLDRMIRAGMNVARINYSHETRESQAMRVGILREQAGKRGVHIGILADLQGPKIRIGRFRNYSIELEEGDEFTIDADLKMDSGDETHVGVTYKDLPRDVRSGDTLLIDDGRIILQVDKVKGNEIKCVVLLGGTLSNNKGINKEGGGLSAKALTTKDRGDLKHAVALGVDFIAISFPRNADDIHAARKLITKAGGNCSVIAKIERAEALDNAEEIIEAADGIMIARGDLGVEIGDACLPPVQKRLIRQAQAMNRVVITATQMMESMIENHLPTRAEVFDVANAVLDGTDAVMLSAETSVGKYPDKTVEAMSRICLETERKLGDKGANYRIDAHFESIDEAIAMSAMYAATHIGAKAIAAVTETGATCMWMSRVRSGLPIFAFTRNLETCRKVTLYRGVKPVFYDLTHTNFLQVNKEICADLKKRGVVKNNDPVIITKGDLRGTKGGTNGLKIVRVGQLPDISD